MAAVAVAAMRAEPVAAGASLLGDEATSVQAESEVNPYTASDAMRCLGALPLCAW